MTRLRGFTFMATVGVAMLVAYFVLAATTTVGDKGDIGGVLILLLGLCLTMSGLAGLVATRLSQDDQGLGDAD